MIELRNIDVFKRSVDAISSFIDEANFRFNDNGITVRAVDPSQIVLVDYAIDKKAFASYEIEPCYVGISVAELSKILGRSMPNDRMLLDVTDNDITIKLEGEFSRSFKLPLIDVPDTEIDTPKASFDAKVEIGGKIIKECVKDAGLFDTAVIVKVKNGSFMMEAKGAAGMMNTAAKKGRHIEIKSNSEAVAKYSLSFLSNIVKEVGNDDKVSFEFKTDSPMHISYNIGSSNIQFYLAPMTF